MSPHPVNRTTVIPASRFTRRGAASRFSTSTNLNAALCGITIPPQMGRNKRTLQQKRNTVHVQQKLQ